MPFVKGKSGNPNGRGKGVLSKKTYEARAIADRLDCDPLEILLLFAKGDWKTLGYPERTVTKFFGESMVTEDVITPELRQKSAKDACVYIYAQLKSVDVVSGGQAMQSPVIFINGE